MVRFLWEAHNCEDSPADAAVQLGVSFAYVERWESGDLEQLWFLGMQILNSLMGPVSQCGASWIGDGGKVRGVGENDSMISLKLSEIFNSFW